MSKLLILILLFVSLPAHSIEGVYTVIIKKQQEKKRTQWSLADWLGTKKKIALMDQWLALNSSKDMFEMAVGASMANNYALEDGTGTMGLKRDLKLYDLSFSYSIFGLWLLSDESSQFGNSRDARIFVRLLGSSGQSTGLNLFYAYRSTKIDGVDTFKQGYYGATFTLYLFSFLGLDASLEKYLKQQGETTSYQLEGERTAWGTFIDVGPVRLFGQYFNQSLKLNHATTPRNLKRSGTLFGLKLFF